MFSWIRNRERLVCVLVLLFVVLLCAYGVATASPSRTEALRAAETILEYLSAPADTTGGGGPGGAGGGGEPDVPRGWQAGSTVLSAGRDGDSDARLSGAVSPVALVQHRAEWLLYYVGSEGDRQDDGGPRRRRLIIATSPDLERWTKRGVAFEWLPNAAEEEAVYSAAILAEGDEVRAWVTACTQTREPRPGRPGAVSCDVRYLTSQDGRRFRDRGEVLSHRDPGVWGHGDELFTVAARRRPGGGLQLWYLARSGTAARELGVAEIDAGGRVVRTGPALPGVEWVDNVEVIGNLATVDDKRSTRTTVYRVRPNGRLGERVGEWRDLGAGDSPNYCLWYDSAGWRMVYRDGERLRWANATGTSASQGGGSGGGGSGGGSSGGDPAGLRPCDWPVVGDGYCVERGGRQWAVRKPDKVRDLGDGVVWFGTRNASSTLVWDPPARSGWWEWQAWYEPGCFPAARGRGKHYHSMFQHRLDLGGRYRDELDEMTVLRFEIADLGTRPRGIVWLYDDDFAGRAELVMPCGQPPEHGRWYDWRFEWAIDARDELVIRVTRDGEELCAGEVAVPGAQGFGQLMPWGHVEGVIDEDAGVRIRNMRWGR